VKSLVVDSSATLGFLLPDESSPLALRALDSIQKAALAYVPAHFWIEVTNALMMAERRKRASYGEVIHALHFARRLPLLIDAETSSQCAGETLSFAREYKLTIYDAAYLELAIRLSGRLATLDGALARAAKAAGVEVLT
jgi:predicted nucleic acid-binding protein